MDNSITIKFFKKTTDEKIRNDIWDILCKCDREFYPPLSARKVQNGLLVLNCHAKTSDKKPYMYFKAMIKQRFLVAFMDDRYVVGFMSFLTNVKDKHFNVNCNYYTTLCVRPANRHKGIATGLLTYQLPEEFKSDIIMTRTWSLNAPIIKSLRRAGFMLKKVEYNDRENGIDTLYYEKFTEKNNLNGR